jgi:hypothetical protein
LRLALALLLSGAAAASQPPVLTPHRTLALPAAFGQSVKDVAWENERTVLVASERLVYRYDLAAAKGRELISAAPVPDGLPTPVAVASDGATAVAVSPWSLGSFTVRLSDGKRLLAQRSPKLVAMDAAIQGSRSCVLARTPLPANDAERAAAVWCGKPDDAFTELAPAHSIRSGEVARGIFKDARGAHAGAIAMEPNGTLNVITSAEPGVYRYAANGALVEILGNNLDELVLSTMHEMANRYGTDVAGRYQRILNAQPTIDDLIATPAGPAIVVRIAAKDTVHWELWYPARGGDVSKRLRLGIARPGPFGHLRCASHGKALACVGSMPPVKDAAIVGRSENHPRLWLMTLP